MRKSWWHRVSPALQLAVSLISFIERLEHNCNSSSYGVEILDRLDFAERTARQQQINNVDALESTLEWVWNKGHESHSSFAQWLSNDQAVFWIQGKPGSGESTLMSYLEKASQSWQLRTESESRWSTIRFFFDFRAHNGLANNLEGLLRSLLLQVLEQTPGPENEIRRLEENFGRGKADTLASSILKETFVNALVQTPENLCILVDGLDEFSGNMQELLTFFLKFPSRTNTGHLLKICLASRPHPVIDLALGDFLGLQMQDHNGSAIKRYAFTTMESLGVAAHDRSWLKRFSADMAKKAEDVFLWARFAVTEVINGYAEGEDTDELEQRLEVLPSDMEEFYANIFRRMTSRDRGEARLLFQLVCFAQDFDGVKFINLRQLREAVLILGNIVAEPAQHVSTYELERFRKRLKAKSGGLLEESSSFLNGAYRKEAPKSFKENGGTIKLIHRTAQSYLDREGWFSGLKSLHFVSPHALWLHICCASMKSVFEPRELQLQHEEPSESYLDKQMESSLFKYASRNLFAHARILELEYQESSFPFLQTVSPTLWRYLRKLYRSYNLVTNLVNPKKTRINWGAVDKGSTEQPWAIIVEQGLPLCLRDAVRNGHYAPPSEGEDLSLAIASVYAWQQYRHHKKEPIAQQLVSHLIDFGALVHQRHIIECLYMGTTEVLRILLVSWPEQRLRPRRYTSFDEIYGDDAEGNETYSGESVGTLWELVRVENVYNDDPEAKLVLLLERGELLNEACGPGGTALHACIIAVHLEATYHMSFKVREIRSMLNHGADPNVSGPRGRPLQLAWRLSRAPRHSLSTYSSAPHYLQQAMRLLLDFGADPSWVEPNGISIDRRTIEAWCAMSEEEMDAHWMDGDYPYCKSNWYTYEFPLYHPAASNVESDMKRRRLR